MPDPVLDGPNNHPSTLSVVDLKWCSSCPRAMRRDWKWDLCSHCRPRYGPAEPPRPKGAVLMPAAPFSQTTHVPIQSLHPVHQVHCAACTIAVHPKDMANLLFCVRCLENGGPTKNLASPPLIIPSQENHFKKEHAPKAMAHFNANGRPTKDLASPPFKVPSQENHVEKGEALRTMPHFNANGELIRSSNVHNVQKFSTHAAPPPAPAPAPAPRIPPPAVRLCRRWRHGCAGVILADASATACANCLTEGHPLYASSPSTSPSKLSKHVPERSHSLKASEVGITSLVQKVKKKYTTYVDSTEPRIVKQSAPGSGNTAYSVQTFNVTTAESFNQFQDDAKRSSSTTHVGQIVLPRSPPEHGQSPAWQSAEHPSTSHLHDTVDPKLRVSSLEPINGRAHDLVPKAPPSASIFDAGKLAENTPTPARSESKTPSVIRFKRKLPSEGAIQSHTEKRRKSESLTTAQAQRDAKKTSELIGWDSDLTELLSSGDEDDDGSDTETEPRVLSGVKIRIPSLSSRKALNTTGLSLQTNSKRLCAIRSCRSALPDPTEYKYKLCKPCRVYLRDYQRKRNLKRQSSHREDMLSLSVSTANQQSTSMSPSKTKIQPTHAVRLPLRTFSHTPAYPEYQHFAPLVESFTGRLRNFMDAFVVWRQLQAKPAAVVNNKSNDVHSSASGEPRVEGQRSVFSGSREGGPDEAGSQQKVDANERPVSFSFEGEYSIIAPKELVPGPKGIEETWQRAGRIVEELERVSGLQFQSISSFGIESGGMIMQFGCLHNIDVPITAVPPSTKRQATEKVEDIQPESDCKALDPTCISISADAVSVASPPDGPPASETSLASGTKGLLLHMEQTIAKTIIGELEVAVMPDRSHRFFIGLRTIIRIRLVG